MKKIKSKKIKSKKIKSKKIKNLKGGVLTIEQDFQIKKNQQIINNPQIYKFIKKCENPNFELIILLLQKYLYNRNPEHFERDYILFNTKKELIPFINFSPMYEIIEYINKQSRPNLELIQALFINYGYDIIHNLEYFIKLYSLYITNPQLENLLKYKFYDTVLSFLSQQEKINFDLINKIFQNYDRYMKDINFINLYSLYITNPQLENLLDKYKFPYEILLYLSKINFQMNKSTYQNEDSILDINIGIEIEGCKVSKLEQSNYKEINNNENKITTFEKDIDLSIICNSDEVKREYILLDYIKLKKLLTLRLDIEAIYKKLTNSNKKDVCKSNCGIHFHISNDNILFDIYGLLFLLNLVQLWTIQKQNEFIGKYPYQLKLYDKSYSAKNPSINYSELKKHILALIKSGEHLEKISLLFDIFYEIRKNNDKSFFLHVYDELNPKNKESLKTKSTTMFIHIEFRGLATSLKNYEKKQPLEIMSEYCYDILEMYNIVAKQCKKDLAEASLLR